MLMPKILPGWLSGKESTCQCGRCGFDPWVRTIPWRRKWQPTPVFLPGESHGQRSLEGYNPQSHKDSDMTEQLTTHTQAIPEQALQHSATGTLLKHRRQTVTAGIMPQDRTVCSVRFDQMRMPVETPTVSSAERADEQTVLYISAFKQQSKFLPNSPYP